MGLCEIVSAVILCIGLRSVCIIDDKVENYFLTSGHDDAVVSLVGQHGAYDLPL